MVEQISEAILPKYRCLICGKELTPGKILCGDGSCYRKYSGLKSFPHRDHSRLRAEQKKRFEVQMEAAFIEMEAQRQVWTETEL
jgi:hypothetical protein